MSVEHKFRKPICNRGHDKRLVGVTSDNHCRQCKMEKDRRRAAKRREGLGYELRYPSNLRTPICKHGHDKRIVGVFGLNNCYECHRLRSNEYKRKQRKGNPEFRGSPEDSEQLKNLRAIRLKLGLTREQLAKLCGMSVSGIDHIEYGRRKASKKTQRKIVAGLARIQKKRRELHAA